MPVTVLASFVSSAGFKNLTKAGTAILGKLTACRVKPKGTPHAEVWRKAPKLYVIYGSGVPGTNDFRKAKSEGGLFDGLNGYWHSSIDGLFPLAERKRIEATLRQPCESVTGDISYYAEVKLPQDDRGYVRLNDGHLYQAAFYGVEGGTLRNPVTLNVPPIASTTGGQPEKTDYSSPVAQSLQAGFPLLAGLAYLLFRRS